jgi:gamma-glutamylputrescine oxidase
LLFNTPIWDDGQSLPLSPLDGDVETDVCVIGLGGSGLTALDELTTMGRRAVGIDARGIAPGAAGRNGGLLLGGTVDFHHDAITVIGRDRAVGIYRETMAEIRRIDEQAPGVVRHTGSIRLSSGPDEDADVERQREAMLADGISCELYEGPLGHGIFMPDDACFNPQQRCRALARRVIAQGAKLYTQTTATSYSATEVRTDCGTIRCAQVIIAVDGRLETLVPELAGTVRTARLQMLATAPVAERLFPAPMSARYGFDYWQQTPDGSVAFGGGRDHSVESEWTTDAEPTDRIQGYLERTLRETLKVTAPITHRWAASVSYTETGLPVLQELRPGLWVIGGYSGTGNVMGALCGRAAARATSGETTAFARLLVSHS